MRMEARSELCVNIYQSAFFQHLKNQLTKLKPMVVGRKMNFINLEISAETVKCIRRTDNNFRFHHENWHIEVEYKQISYWRVKRLAWVR